VSPNGNSTGTQGICHFTAELNREAFSDMLFPRGMACKLILTGVCFIQRWNGSARYGRTYGIDACYEEVDPGNYTRPHDLLYIDRMQFRKEALEEDRALHRYILPYKGTGGRLGVLLKVPSDRADYLRNGSEVATGTIEITVASLSAGELADLGLASKEFQQEAERYKQEAERQAALQRHAISLAARAHLEQNFLDEGFRERYATKYLSQILTTEKEAWLNLYRNVLTDSDLLTLVHKEHGHIMPWLEALLETARIAERLALKPQLKEKPRLTPQEWQARIERYRQRQLSRMRVDADDRIALLLERFEAFQRLRDRAGELGLDAGKIEELEDELDQDLRKGLDEEDDTDGGGYKQV
jgi:hypothetical protein